MSEPTSLFCFSSYLQPLNKYSLRDTMYFMLWKLFGKQNELLFVLPFYSLPKQSSCQEVIDTSISGNLGLVPIPALGSNVFNNVCRIQWGSVDVYLFVYYVYLFVWELHLALPWWDDLLGIFWQFPPPREPQSSKQYITIRQQHELSQHIDTHWHWTYHIFFAGPPVSLERPT